jgi:hypothetical protein
MNLCFGHGSPRCFLPGRIDPTQDVDHHTYRRGKRGGTKGYVCDGAKMLLELAGG